MPVRTYVVGPRGVWAFQHRAEYQGFGVLAQLVERLHGMQEVSGSNPLSSTTFEVVMALIG